MREPSAARQDPGRGCPRRHGGQLAISGLGRMAVLPDNP
jgi:hypothetical protein